MTDDETKTPSAEPTNELHLASDLKLPLPKVALYAYGILGIRGSGKTWTATLSAEWMMSAGIPITAIDPIGRWWGLKVAKKEGEQGFPVVVIGGRHADVELEPDHDIEAFKRLIITAIEKRISIVVDVYGRRYSKAFRRRLVAAAADIHLDYNEDYGRRHIFLEEAAEYVPQNVKSEHGKCFEAVETLVRMGRNINCGVTMINQRAADINKSVLEQCEILVCHQQTGKNSLKALREWMDIAGAGGQEGLVTQLASLEKGTAWFWAPRLKILQKIHVNPKYTIHPDPESGDWDPQDKDSFMMCDVSESVGLLTAALDSPKKQETETKVEYDEPATPPDGTKGADNGTNEPDSEPDERDQMILDLQESNELLSKKIEKLLVKKKNDPAEASPATLIPANNQAMTPDQVLLMIKTHEKQPKIVVETQRQASLHRYAELAVQRMMAWIISESFDFKRVLQYLVAVGQPIDKKQLREAMKGASSLTDATFQSTLEQIQAHGLIHKNEKGEIVETVMLKLQPFLNRIPVDEKRIRERIIEVLELHIGNTTVIHQNPPAS